jgi:hypothetical protein
MTDIKITGERPGSSRDPGVVTVYLGQTDEFSIAQAQDLAGPVTVELPGLTAIRIETATRTIAIDNISGTTTRGEPCLPEWTLHDLRNGTYGDFHRLKPAGECFDPEGCRDAADTARREHVELVAEPA